MDHTSIIEQITDELRIPVKVVDVTEAPQVIRYAIKPQRRTLASGKPGRKVRVRWIESHVKDIALALGQESVRIVQNGQLYIEVGKDRADPVLTDPRSIVGTSTMRIPIVLGIGTDNQPVAIDLGSAPHLMVAGTTGSGKSVCLINILANLISQKTPRQLNLLLIDLKRTELTRFACVKHLNQPPATTLEEAMRVLQWLLAETERRFVEMEKRSVRHAKELGYASLVLVIEEFVDLILVGGDAVSDLIVRIAQIGRAADVHIIAATQTPRRSIINGLIDANFPVRIAFKTVNGTDSKIALGTDGGHAERLMGRGDGLLWNAGRLARFQGAFTTDAEIERFVSENRSQSLPTKPQQAVTYHATKSIMATLLDTVIGCAKEAKAGYERGLKGGK